jgi:hypothetical protein
MTTDFRFVAYRDFKRTLGKINAVVECAELATRKFVDEAEHAADPDKFVQQVSAEYTVRVDKLDIPLLKQQIAQFHVASVHQEFESFLKDLAREIRGELIQRPKDKSLLEATLVELFGGYDKSVRAIGRFGIEVADYYRQVRNGFAHTGADGVVKKDVNALRKLVEEQGDSFSRLDAPNLHAAINFDDFILFARVVKQLALKLCQAARPSDEEIVEMVLRLDEAGHRNVDLMKLASRNPMPVRRRRALVGLLRTLYSLQEDESTPIVELFLSGPLA